MWWLRFRLWLLYTLMFALIYAVLVMASSAIGLGGFWFYVVLASVILFVQYMLGPKLIEMSMRLSYVSESEYPKLHKMVERLAGRAGIPKPRVAVANLTIPNAFAFGRSIKDGRVCVTAGIMNLLSDEELEAVLGHEISHIRNRDMLTITMISVIPMILWYMAWNLMWSRRSRGGGNTALLGLGAFILYFVSNLLVLYGSRIREYYADKGSVDLGCKPHDLATALYKLVYGSARMPKEALKQAEGYKAFFLNDPSRAENEISELSEIDKDMSGTIDDEELATIRNKKPHIKGSDRFMELLSTHPNMLKRIRHLSTLT